MLAVALMPLLLIGVLLGLPVRAQGPAHADEAAARVPPPTALQVLRVKGDAEVVLDGTLDEEIWSRVPTHDRFVQLQPRDRQEARWRTTVQVIIDRGALIVGIRAFDPAPEAIRAPLVRRDRVARSQDYVAVFIDPVGLRRSAQFVRVSASGIVADGLYSARDAAENLAPDFDVQAAARRLPDGYSVELRIPFAELRYPLEGGQPWRLMVTRSVPRGENALWVSAPLTSDALHLLAEMPPIAAADDLVDELRDRGFLRVRPELTWRRTQARAADGRTTSDNEALLGVSVKWRPRADWIVDGMVNPDFSQVELDQPQLSGNVRYALRQAEKRPFFLESLDVTGQGQGNEDGSARGLAAFYSRALANPRWGLRATWRGADGDATALAVRDKGGGTMLRPYAYGTIEAPVQAPSSAAFLRRRWQLGDLGVATLLSNRDYGGGRYNRVGGASVEGELGSDWQWRAQGLLSSTTADLNDDDMLEATRARSGHYLWVDLQHRSERWASRLHLEEISPRFANDNGFVNQSGIRRVSYELNRRLGVMPMGWFEADEFELQLALQETRTMADDRHGVPSGERADRSISPGIWFSGPRMLDAWMHANARSIRNETGGRLHEERTLDFGMTINPSAWFATLRLEWESGRMLDVDADRIVNGRTGRTEMLLRVPLPGGTALEAAPLLSWSRLDRPGGGRSLDEWAGRLLTVFQWSAEHSVRLILQRQRSTREEEPNLLSATRSTADTRSFIYQHRQPRGTVLAFGVTDTRAAPSGRRNTEWFAKYSVDFWR
ncbi:hypothetical protein CDN99_20520 [Roseateles aquatilis]|uniref:Carbohydrate-binding domain-containing protein n=1 Tax=Roseateles aquatilis TaxID=431061 RepID=A0A246J180_9BURK|nr:carbohydrate binding family 9 domain-containing protein [Roseateles aquatilis]OWQ86222.1 hypothetical protein CDN99_20520 [Roseateles aquatilis]